MVGHSIVGKIEKKNKKFNKWARFSLLNIISGENKGPGTKYERILERD
jgi:hypothetical protein